MKKIMRILLALYLMLGTITCGYGESEAAAQDGIAWFMGTYNYTLPASTLEISSVAFTPVTFDCGAAQVTIENILYDGMWIYTSAILAPSSPEESLIMPDDADSFFPVAGVYGENLRDDHRTFAEAAIEDGKQLVRTLAVPQEYYELDYFICGSRQDAGDTSTMVCAAPCLWIDEEINICFRVDVTVIDPATDQAEPTTTYEFPLTVKRLGSVEMAKYHSDQGIEALGYDTIMLVKTPLTVYAYAEKGMNRHPAPVNMMDGSASPLPKGVPIDGTTTFDLPALPSQLYIHVGILQDQAILFSMEDVSNTSEKAPTFFD